MTSTVTENTSLDKLASFRRFYERAAKEWRKRVVSNDDGKLSITCQGFNAVATSSAGEGLTVEIYHRDGQSETVAVAEPSLVNENTAQAFVEVCAVQRGPKALAL